MMESSRQWASQLPTFLPVASLCVVGDVEACSHHPAATLLAAWRAGQQRQSACVLESLFPEIRSLAYLLAAGGSPTRGDWLAARVAVLQLTHLELALTELPMMDAVNCRLMRLSHLLGLALPQLRSFAVAVAGQSPLLLCGSGAHVQVKQSSPLAQSLALRGLLAGHLAAVRQGVWRALALNKEQ